MAQNESILSDRGESVGHLTEVLAAGISASRRSELFAAGLMVNVLRTVCTVPIHPRIWGPLLPF